MSEIVNQSLQKIAKGTGIVFIGTFIGMLLGYSGYRYCKWCGEGRNERWGLCGNI